MSEPKGMQNLCEEMPFLGKCKTFVIEYKSIQIIIYII